VSEGGFEGGGEGVRESEGGFEGGRVCEGG
jgi:hypothetical protein